MEGIWSSLQGEKHSLDCLIFDRETEPFCAPPHSLHPEHLEIVFQLKLLNARARRSFASRTILTLSCRHPVKGLILPLIRWPGPELERVAQTMRQEGTVFVYGALPPEPTPFPLFAAIGSNLTFRGYTLLSIVMQNSR